MQIDAQFLFKGRMNPPWDGSPLSCKAPTLSVSHVFLHYVLPQHISPNAAQMDPSRRTKERKRRVKGVDRKKEKWTLGEWEDDWGTGVKGRKKIGWINAKKKKIKFEKAGNKTTKLIFEGHEWESECIQLYSLHLGCRRHRGSGGWVTMTTSPVGH